MNDGRNLHKAILIVPESQSEQELLCRYGGETLIGRSLIALSRCDFKQAWIISTAVHVKTIRLILNQIRHRITPDCKIIEKQSSLSETIKSLIATDLSLYLIFETDKILHATVLEQLQRIRYQDHPCLPVFSGVYIENGMIRFSPSVKEKFRIQFEDIQSLFLIEHSSSRGLYYICTEMVVCKSHQLDRLESRDRFKEIQFEVLQHINSPHIHVEPAWWLKISPAMSQHRITSFFWKMAFKEISGEFSKRVNSVFSKPLSLWFTCYRFTPMLISWIAFIFLIASSCLLLLPFYWTLILSGFLWQSAAVLDRCDGEVARMRNYESEKNARFDMVTDDLGYLVQFICLTGICFFESHFDVLYIIVFLLSLTWIGSAVIHEQGFMSHAGYLSRQVYRQDFIKLLSYESIWTKIYLQIETYGRRDFRGIIYFGLTLLGSKILIFWTFIAFVWILGCYMFYAVHKLQMPGWEIKSTLKKG